jgi:hypothetical protein
MEVLAAVVAAAERQIGSIMVKEYVHEKFVKFEVKFILSNYWYIFAEIKLKSQNMTI